MNIDIGTTSLLTLSDPSWYLGHLPSLAATDLLVAVLVALGRYTRTRPAERSGKTGSLGGEKCVKNLGKQDL